jgi:glycosyltransferase involved in cell wall biosynthesis
MIERPLVSVITIFLDEERFLEEAIDSVLTQTYGQWELLLVDDGSSDGSTEIAIRAARRDPGRVRYLEHPGHRNRGMSSSRNLGLAHAAGEFIALLDADDVWPARVLERQVAALSARPSVGMTYGPSRWWYGWTGEPADLQRDVVDFTDGRGVPADATYPPPTLLTQLLLDGGCVPCPCSILLRRAVLEAAGGFEDAFTGLYEDQVLVAKMSLAAPVFVSAEWLGLYRQHEQSCCAVGARTGADRLARRQYLEWLRQYLDTNRIANRPLRAAWETAWRGLEVLA